MPISDFWISRGQTPAGIVLLIRNAIGGGLIILLLYTCHYLGLMFLGLVFYWV